MRAVAFAQKEGKEKNAAENRQLRRLKVSESKIQPTPSPENLYSDKKDKDQEDDAKDVEGNRT